MNYKYSLKFSIGTIAVMVILMLLVLSSVINANTMLGWVVYLFFAILFTALIAIITVRRLIPAIKGNIALALDEDGINDYIRDAAINWKDIENIRLVRGRSASMVYIDLKFESDHGKYLSIALRWVQGKDEDIYDAMMAYFEQWQDDERLS